MHVHRLVRGLGREVEERHELLVGRELVIDDGDVQRRHADPGDGGRLRVGLGPQVHDRAERDRADLRIDEALDPARVGLRASPQVLVDLAHVGPARVRLAVGRAVLEV
jgi:hypothetical protein